ncbi:uncharacterized protein [Triticum aestivum]|uniref:uncharacterized protein n=1 Tax=Triticum aestivum TaxID=4565 RepID=UPI001D00C4E4|nr:uncharacterized protein LOC123139272 [Triticum aestivum]
MAKGEEGSMAKGEAGSMAEGGQGSTAEVGQGSSGSSSITGSLLGIPVKDFSRLMKSGVDCKASVVRVLVKKETEVDERQRDGTVNVGSALVALAGNQRVLCLTANHIFLHVKGDVKPYLRFCGEPTDYELTIIYQDEACDLCLFMNKFEIDGLQSKVKSMIFNPREINEGTHVVVLGYSHPTLILPNRDGNGRDQYELVAVKRPTPLPGTLCIPGYVKESFKGDEFYEALKYNVSAMSGFSGSPVIVEGQVIGIHLGREAGERDGIGNRTIKTTLRRWLNILDGDDEHVTIEELLARINEVIRQRIEDQV